MRECWNGRQARLRCVCRMAWEFESPLSHHVGAKSALLRRLFCLRLNRRHPPAPLLLLSSIKKYRFELTLPQKPRLIVSSSIAVSAFHREAVGSAPPFQGVPLECCASRKGKVQAENYESGRNTKPHDIFYLQSETGTSITVRSPPEKARAGLVPARASACRKTPGSGKQASQSFAASPRQEPPQAAVALRNAPAGAGSGEIKLKSRFPVVCASEIALYTPKGSTAFRRKPRTFWGAFPFVKKATLF